MVAAERSYDHDSIHCLFSFKIFIEHTGSLMFIHVGCVKNSITGIKKKRGRVGGKKQNDQGIRNK